MGNLNWDRNFALEQAGDQEEILKELLVLFRESSLSDCAKIKTGIEAGDGGAVADAAHSIKGAAASLGIESIRLVTHEIEMAGRNQDIDAAGRYIEELEQLLELATGLH